MLFRINVSIKKRKILWGWGEILCFIYVFVIMHTCMLQKMYNSAPWGHISVGRRIQCNTGTNASTVQPAGYSVK